MKKEGKEQEKSIYIAPLQHKKSSQSVVVVVVVVVDDVDVDAIRLLLLSILIDIKFYISRDKQTDRQMNEICNAVFAGDSRISTIATVD